MGRLWSRLGLENWSVGLGVKLGGVCGVAGQMDGHCCGAACL